MGIFRSPKAPSLETPDGCRGRGSIIAEPIQGDGWDIEAIFSCMGLEDAEPAIIFESGLDKKRYLTSRYMDQFKKVTEDCIYSLCGTCPLSPLNNPPDYPPELSNLDKPPEGA